MVSDITISAALVALPATILALGSFLGILKGNQKADKAIAQNEVLDRKTDTIHQLADGNLSRISAELKTSNDKIQSMEKLIAMLEQKWGRGPVLTTQASEGAAAREADAALERFREQK